MVIHNTQYIHNQIRWVPSAISANINFFFPYRSMVGCATAILRDWEWEEVYSTFRHKIGLVKDIKGGG